MTPFAFQAQEAPVPFPGFGGATNISYASGHSFGPFYLGQWPGLQFLFTPNVVNQQILFQWYFDSALTIPLGSFVFDVSAGQTVSYIWPNAGPYLQVTIFNNGGGTNTGKLFLSGSPQQGKVCLTNSFNNLFGTNNLLVAPGIANNQSYFTFFPYTGAAQVSGFVDQPSCLMVLNYLSYTGQFLGQMERFNLTKGQESSRIDYIPPKLIQVVLSNRSTVNAHFNISIIPELITG